MIMEGESIAKARYQFIGGEWKGGNINRKLMDLNISENTETLYNPIRERNFSEIMNLKWNYKSLQIL